MTVNDVYQQFVDYYGESRVDLQKMSNSRIRTEYTDDPENFAIIVYWPEVTVTNENDKSIKIWELYSATIVDATGRLIKGPLFSRSAYDKTQWRCSYMHSHVSSIPSDIRVFMSSCLGSGPLVNTKGKLSSSNNDDLNDWTLYCWELDKYVTVESLIGCPYNRLEQVGDRNTEYKNFKISMSSYNRKDLIDLLIDYILRKNILKFGYMDGKYIIASTYVNTVLDISNAFIELYNSDSILRSKHKRDDLHGFLQKLVICGDTIYEEDNSSRTLNMPVGTHMYDFKGKPVIFKLKETKQDYNANHALLINPEIINYIVYKILKYVNARYGKYSDTTDKIIRVF